MKKICLPVTQRGFAAILTLLIIAAVVVLLAISAGLISLRHQRATYNIVRSSQSLVLAEAALEDSLLRITDPSLSYQPSETLTLNGYTATSTISQVGNTFTVASRGDVESRIRRLGIELVKNTTEASFFYGVQVGEGGLQISHNDGKVLGNVYANGTSYGSGSVTGSITIGGDGNELQDLRIGEDAFAYGCDKAQITGDLTTTSGGVSTCTVGGSTSTQSESFETLDFPISDEQINTWKSQAADGGTLSGNQTISSNQNLGPIKIDGNLTISNNVTVNLTGTVWVTGTFTTGNNAIVALDPGYGANSGIFIVDGKIDLNNNVTMRGTSDPASYLMVIGTSSSQAETSAAMDVKNNLAGAILFTPHGIMVVHNNVNLMEAMAHKLLLKKATISYQTGLENVNFSSGPSGGWDIRPWQETQ